MDDARQLEQEDMFDGAVDFTHIAAGEQRADVQVKRTGALNIALITRLTAESNAAEWEQAKDEWRVTGNVWYIPIHAQAYRLQ